MIFSLALAQAPVIKCVNTFESFTKNAFMVQIIGKALVLDEIINYIQSLQWQVEVW